MEAIVFNEMFLSYEETCFLWMVLCHWTSVSEKVGKFNWSHSKMRWNKFLLDANF